MRARIALGLLLAGGLLGLAWWVFVLNPAPVVRGGPSAVRERPQGDAYVLAASEPANLNPFTTTLATARRLVLKYTHDTLLDLDPVAARLRPALATHVRSEGRVHEFELRKGLRFGDGSPVTLEDLRFTFEVGRDPDVVLGACRQALDLIASCELLPPRRFRVTLNADHFAALPIVATNYFLVRRAWFVDQVRAVAARAGVEVPAGPGSPGFGRLLEEVKRAGPGTGPYQIGVDAATGRETFEPKRSLILVRNELSWRRAAQPDAWNLQQLRLVFTADADALRAMVRDQAVDWYFTADPHGLLLQEPRLARHYVPLVYDHERLGHYMVVWNHGRGALGDARVRRALTMLFDREAISKTVFGGHARVATSWWKPGTENYPKGRAPLPFDPAAARQLLLAAGAVAEDRRLRLEVIYGTESGFPYPRQIFELAQDACRRVGVDLVPRPLGESEFEGPLVRRDFDAILCAQNHEPWIDPYHEFHSEEAGRRNWTGFSHKESDRLLAQARVEPDTARRLELHRRWDEIFHEQQPVTLLVHPLATCLFHRRFQGALPPGRLGLVPESWWVEPGEQRYR